MEILVVSPAGVSYSAKHFSCRTIRTPSLYPPGKMRNIGAREAAGDILVFLDDDCLAPPGWPAAIARSLKRQAGAGCVGCRLLSMGDRFWDRCADYSLFSCYQHGAPGDRDLGSAAIAVHRQAFDSVSGFDESLLSSEDWDFSLKLRSKGYRTYFDSRLEVRHDHRRGSIAAIVGQSFKSGLNSGLQVQKKHKDRGSLLARLMARISHPALYLWMILPYVSILMIGDLLNFVPNHCKVLLYLPLVFGSRLIYQAGVLERLRRDHLGLRTQLGHPIP